MFLYFSFFLAFQSNVFTIPIGSTTTIVKTLTDTTVQIGSGEKKMSLSSSDEKFQEYEVLQTLKLDGKDYTVTKIAPYAFCESKIYKVILPPTIEFIGEGCFSESYLQEIDLSQTLVTKLPQYCFYKCKYLKNVVLPLDLVKIGKFAFGIIRL